RDLAVAVV
ncbi:hypothetical protein KIPB_016209, partial [Kipferlia bialata]